VKRLFAFGCSFTNYAWPTYADFLSYEFDKYENWGFPGLGNRAIAERIAECHAKNNFNSNDTILVQWTSHVRNDFHTFKEIEYSKEKFIHGYFRPTNKIGWKTQGNIFGSGNLEINYDNKWINSFWDEYSYVMYTMNEILLTQGLLEATNCTWRMITISDIKKLGSDVPDIQGETSRDDIDLWEDKPEFNCYKKAIFEGKYKDKWLEPIGLFAWKRKEDLYTFKGPNDPESYKDFHPSHKHHYEYMNKVVRPSLNINSENNNKQQSTYNKITELKKQNKDFISFEEQIIHNKPHEGYIGF
jgi:hypothetical protein|tara:strand:- start:849 stop:1748 length:900 start_codon:yes stop_codon:yes gene_type:complete